MFDFEEYKRLGEPEKKEKSEIWSAAIGLQRVDGLTPSDYLIKTARQNIEGEITFYEVKERLNDYYKARPVKKADDRTEEADKVSAHIAEVLSEKTFTFSPAEYITIHKRLFTGIYKHAGKIRDYNITKSEWVLNGETVYYASADMIKETLDFDFSQEKAFSYKNLTKEQMVERFAKFVSGIWQIHAFGEGNTRTTAVFSIKYLRTLGFNVNNDVFVENSWYFRNALVRANYSDYRSGVFSTLGYLTRFFGNLLLGEKNILKNREMHIHAAGGGSVNDTVNAQNATVKEDNATVKIKNATANGYNATVKGYNFTENGENTTVNDRNATVKRKNATVKTKDATVKLSSTQWAVLELLNSNGRLTAEDMASDIGKDISTIKRATKVLKNKGVLERIGSDKTGSWKVLKTKGGNVD